VGKEDLRKDYTRTVIELLEELEDPHKTDLWNGIDELVKRKIIYDFRLGKNDEWKKLVGKKI
jgi:hypothetical protein